MTCSENPILSYFCCGTIGGEGGWAPQAPSDYAYVK